MMNVYQCSERIRQIYAAIGSGEQGYHPAALEVVLKTLNQLSQEPTLSVELREQAAFAAANLLISDHRDHPQG